MTVIGDAISGLAKSVAGLKEHKSSHQAFIDGKLLAHTIKLQKEAGWRRYKVCLFGSSFMTLFLFFNSLQ
jgi:hypothetical protein